MGSTTPVRFCFRKDLNCSVVKHLILVYCISIYTTIYSDCCCCPPLLARLNLIRSGVDLVHDFKHNPLADTTRHVLFAGEQLLTSGKCVMSTPGLWLWCPHPLRSDCSHSVFFHIHNMLQITWDLDYLNRHCMQGLGTYLSHYPRPLTICRYKKLGLQTRGVDIDKEVPNNRLTYMPRSPNLEVSRMSSQLITRANMSHVLTGYNFVTTYKNSRHCNTIPVNGCFAYIDVNVHLA